LDRIRVTLMHNPGAGTNCVSRENLMDALRRAGFSPVYQSTDEQGFEAALDDPGEMVIIAGGDGTVHKVATRIQRPEIPFAVLPSGTANNIARAVGTFGPLEEIIDGLSTPDIRPFDIGCVRGPWGERPFFEAVGCGLFAHMLSSLEQDEDETLGELSEEGHPAAYLEVMKRILMGALPCSWRVTIDGASTTGSQLLLEVLNIPSIGPNLLLAPDADPGDGLLDVVMVNEEQRQTLLDFLDTQKRRSGTPPRLTVKQVSRLEIHRGTSVLHVDDELWPKDAERRFDQGSVEVTVRKHALRVASPGPR
jgi:diacylglycerol kinase (ATP)